MAKEIKKNNWEEKMTIPEEVREAINQMFLCSSLIEHMACYQHYYNELKDCVFVAFSDQEGTELPEVLQTNYNNEFV